ncbi:Nucleoside-diphosphate-sugar epimerase [Roseivivax lentus]|uniref:Nucleoside-diphosphate-sugar epimerase n=1 Tax=Roseivivax lentus TaxID=633194 RepID=A0A1N7PM88_9RHOB|nr:NAD(P)-dependent oxidoreductase [Roseivivax lentus]SIT11499.1 Nucleoside-diphosphate-sugar epimerase [Roseivivax lentus]
MRIVFTGGSGKAGRHVLPYLRDQGHRILNLDRVPLGADGIHDLKVDLTDSGQVWNAMTQLFDLSDLDGAGVEPLDAVVHFAAVPRIGLVPDNVTFAENATATYNVIEAAVKLGVPKIIFASSETTYGICFAQGEVLPDYLPIDEDHPTVPHDSYAMSKVCNEATARSFQARSGPDIYGLRINNVIEPHEYAENFPAYVADPDLRRRNIFAYIDARDLGLMVERCLQTDGLGYEVFNVANPEPSVDLGTAAIAERFYPGVPFKAEMGAYETFYSIEKARRLLGFAPPERWREALGMGARPE